MTVTQVSPSVSRRRIEIPVILAFFAIYVIWGSTFLAIRTAVLLAPPWFSAGTRFFTAGVILYVFARLRGAPRPSMREWRSLAVIGFLMFSVTYGALFWGEQYVPSGVTSVLESSLPLLTVLFEVFVFRQQRFRWRILFAVTVGFAGVALMLLRNGGTGFPILPCFIILGGSAAWSLGSVLTKSLPLPSSRTVAAAAEMMVGGSLLLILSAVTGELHPFPALPAKAIFSLLYLITAGSLLGFTAFVWLLGRMPASKVASHAYVNPIVALALGHFLASEQITLRTLLGAALVIGSVFLTMREE
ncbi:Permease of the drug/metabolite transporter (DMT) superfamily [Acidisarcina polymorpha]|uniref:Permease of the drug/metabolite transporter (DMT) superfamily n=1 Tax=Acidisarcina polymorpha TaxID=2211140 RepID=A0A2Z5G3Y5_9BACT|nr:EamA family transporter [Acidisarcina polymorpha]AXC13514.1 Permease of the drug/metabolite transporter (DMT) superfamily [Acidisarcina polymorpha]